MRPVKYILLGLSAAALVACDSGPKPLPTAKLPPAVAPKSEPETAPPAAALTPEAVAYVYNYNPLGKRDPYRVPEEIAGLKAGLDPNRECMDPLCQWDLEQLVLTAVVTGDANPFGMLLDPKGRGYIVRRGTKVGRQGGKVTQILRDQITVTEFWIQDNKRVAIPNDMKIKQERGSVPAMDLVTGKIFD